MMVPRETLPIRMLEVDGDDAGLDAVDAPGAAGARPSSIDATDPGTVILTCANCGAPMDERRCKLICRCGYFLSCSDYY